LDSLGRGSLVRFSLLDVLDVLDVLDELLDDELGGGKSKLACDVDGAGRGVNSSRGASLRGASKLACSVLPP
jgi:hypothetical protein